MLISIVLVIPSLLLWDLFYADLTQSMKQTSMIAFDWLQIQREESVIGNSQKLKPAQMNEIRHTIIQILINYCRRDGELLIAWRERSNYSFLCLFTNLL